MVSAPPRRLHPATVIVRALRGAPSTLLGLPALAAVMSGRQIAWFVLAAVAAVVIGGVAGWVRWRAFTYTLGDDGLVIASGVFHKSRRSIPLERIQDVAVEQKLLARVFGLALVRIETGGGKADDGVLDSVSLSEAERLRDALRQPRESAPAAIAAETPATPAPTVEPTIFAMSLGRVLTMGAFRFSLVWVAAVFTALQFADNFIDIDRGDIARWLGVAGRDLASVGGVAVVAALLLAAVLIGIASGLARTLVAEFGFRLTLAAGRFRRTRGLLTRTEVVVATRRIQLALIERGVVSGRLGWATLKFQTLGGSNDPTGRQEMVPFGRDEDIAPVLADAGLPPFDPQPLREVALGHVARACITRGGLPLVAILVGGFFFPPALFALALVPIPIATALLARRHHRYAVAGDTLQVTRGVLARREWIVPLGRVQAVTVSSSWLQRRLGIATVAVGTAGASGLTRPDIVDVARGDAAALAMSITGAVPHPAR